MQINNTHNQSFTAVKFNQKTATKILNQPQEIRQAISVAGEELKATKNWHMHINSDMQPIITNEKGTAYTAPIVFHKPTGNTVFFDATSAKNGSEDKLPFDYHSFFNFESPNRAVAEYNRLQAMASKPIERSAEMIKIEEHRELNRQFSSAKETNFQNLIHDIKE